MKLHRSINHPLRLITDWHELWEGDDGGLIACWECGRTTGPKKPEMAMQALAGEFVSLPWKGGLDPENVPKTKIKFGSLKYLAMWQGLRNEDLSIDTEHASVLICTATNVAVTFTGDHKIISNA